MGHKRHSNQIRMYYIFLFIDLAYIQRTKQQKVGDIAEKEKVSASTNPPEFCINPRNVNIPWAVGNVGDADYIYAFQKVVMPIAYEFNPQLVIGTSSLNGF
jgi:hypothetical protein